MVMKKQASKPQAQEKFRTSILRLANDTICKDRAATHGEAEDSFSAIAAYWSVYLTKETGISIQVTRQDVAQLMVLFKIARVHSNPTHMDNWLDQAGYTALAGEMAMFENQATASDK